MTVLGSLAQGNQCKFRLFRLSFHSESNWGGGKITTNLILEGQTTNTDHTVPLIPSFIRNSQDTCYIFLFGSGCQVKNVSKRVYLCLQGAVRSKQVLTSTLNYLQMFPTWHYIYIKLATKYSFACNIEYSCLQGLSDSRCTRENLLFSSVFLFNLLVDRQYPCMVYFKRLLLVLVKAKVLNLWVTNPLGVK